MLPGRQKYRIAEPDRLVLAVAAVRFHSAEDYQVGAVAEANVRVGVVLQIIGNDQGGPRFVDFPKLASNVARADAPLIPDGRSFAGCSLTDGKEGSVARDKAYR